MSETASSLVLNARDLPSLPSIYDRINGAVNNPHSSLAEVGNIISEDVGLTSRMLRLVNSAFFGFPSKISTVSHACAIVGTSQIRSLVLATSAIEAFEDKYSKASIACAMASRAIARVGGERDVERFFVAGLLHDIGRLVMVQVLGEKYVPVLQGSRSQEKRLYASERRILGFNHADVGGELLNLWKLPPSLVEATALHHSPLRARAYPAECAATQLGNVIAHAMGLGDSACRFVPVFNPADWDLMGVSEEALSRLTEEVDSQFEEISGTILEAV